METGKNTQLYQEEGEWNKDNIGLDTIGTHSFLCHSLIHTDCISLIQTLSFIGTEKSDQNTHAYHLRFMEVIHANHTTRLI